MKTYRNLWQKFISFENLYIAAKKAEKGKRWKESTLKFNVKMEDNLLNLKKELEDGSYCPGFYHNFTIYEPKKRMISAAPYKDRVVHHAIINIIEPIWEKRFYYHSYACRVSKGTHRAIYTCQKYLRKNKYVLKCDIEKYFLSIDHHILKQLVRRRIQDTRLLALIDLIIDSSPIVDTKLKYFEGDDLFTPLEMKKGIPIGNLTSQFWANLYLHELDKFLKFDKKVKFYLRYMDDFIIFHNSKVFLKELRKEIEEYLKGLRLNLHKKKQQIFPSKNGVPFLGFNIYQTHRRLKQENIRRFVKRMKEKQRQYSNYEIDLEDIRTSIMAWIGHAKHGNTWRLRNDLFAKISFYRTG